MDKTIKNQLCTSEYSLFDREPFDENLDLKFTIQKLKFKIQYELKKRHMSQANLAEILQVTPQFISKFMKGEDYKLSTLVKMELALSINLIDRNIKKLQAVYIFEQNVTTVYVRNFNIPTIDLNGHYMAEFLGFQDDNFAIDQDSGDYINIISNEI